MMQTNSKTKKETEGSHDSASKKQKNGEHGHLSERKMANPLQILMPALLLFLLFWWDYKQLFLCSWWRSFWRTLLVMPYCLLFLALTASLIAVVIMAIEAVGRAS